MSAENDDRDPQTGRRVALIGIAASALLATLNIVVGVLTQSSSVVATGLEFAGDVLASSVVLLGMIVAVRPADDSHPYGHGRIETLAAFIVGVILALGGAGICWNSLQAVGARHAPPSAAAILVLGVAIAVRAVMSAVKFRVGRRIRSASLVADAWNDTESCFASSSARATRNLAATDHCMRRSSAAPEKRIWRARPSCVVRWVSGLVGCAIQVDQCTMDVNRRFADLGLGLVDGSVVALAESLGIRRLATRDVRHFAAVRLRDGRPFELVVRPTNPDQS